MACGIIPKVFKLRGSPTYRLNDLAVSIFHHYNYSTILGLVMLDSFRILGLQCVHF